MLMIDLMDCAFVRGYEIIMYLNLFRLGIDIMDNDSHIKAK